jgi:hypothetical protein
MSFGVLGLVGELGIGGALQVARWLVAADLLHDLVLAPAVCLVGWVVVRRAPVALRVPLGAALLVSGTLLVVALPALRGYGRSRVPDNPTVQPLDYTSATLTALAIVWAGAAIWSFVRIRTRTSADREGAVASRRQIGEPEPQTGEYLEPEGDLTGPRGIRR